MSEPARVALTEADVEAWINYASLCREVQGGTPLRISVAARVGVYRDIRTRFETATAAEQVAMASLGATWPQVERAWRLADYEGQQAWIAAAPLPGPMTGRSGDYARTIVQGDVTGHVQALEVHFGPFTATADLPMFPAEEPATP